MSLEAIVWLIVGVGIGVGACLMLLMLYAGLERWRLGRRLRRARVLRDVPAPRETPRQPAPPGSKLALLDRKAEPREKSAGSGAKARPVVEPAVVTAPKTVRDAPLEPVPATAAIGPEPETPPTVDVAPEPLLEMKPEVPAATVAPVTPPNPPPAVAIVSPPRPPQSVEDMFAEAFALDKVSVAPLTSTKDEAS